MPGLDYPWPEVERPGSKPRPPMPTVEECYVDPLTGSEWDQLVLSHPEANFFHSTAWAKVLTQTYGHKPFYLRLSRNGALLALVPLMEIQSRLTGRRGVCLPFSDFCTPLFFNGFDPRAVEEKLSALAAERNWKYFEVREGDAHDWAPVSAVEYYGHRLDLRSEEQTLFDGFSSAVRRAIRKAEQNRLQVEVSQSHDSVAEFYRLHKQTRRRHGLPPQPFAFFQNLFVEAIEKGTGFVVRANRESKCVAAAIFLQFGRSALYKFGASESAGRDTRANNLVIWEAIRVLARGRCDFLHFGRTSLSDAGLRRFKLGWGTTETLIKTFRWSPSTGQWIKGCDQAKGWHNKWFARAPLALNQLTGSLIYPHLD